MGKLRYILVTAAVVVAVALCVTLVVVAKLANHQKNLTTRNTAALTYICTTTHVLDTIVKLNITQIQSAKDAGEYARLEATGVLTAQDVKNIDDSLALLKSSRTTLEANGACTPLHRTH